VRDPNLVVGFERADDAGVYKLSDDLALIQTVDFFTPIVDEPFVFGQIAAANALSDVYAMGGRPLTAMNVVCFPSKAMGIEVLQEILRGGLEKLKESGTTLVGGHSIEDSELKYGLAVTGLIDPRKVVTNVGAQAGDVVVLTKPLGTGIVSTAMKGGMASGEAIKQISDSMAALNKSASECMQEVGAHACTDVTGFGLLGHACEMVRGTSVGMVVHAETVPLFQEARRYAGMGFVPGGTQRNRTFFAQWVECGTHLDSIVVDVLFDPQTSGGLLIAVAKEDAGRLLRGLEGRGVRGAAVIGEVVAHPQSRVVVA
jgi:selenide, water dikinase